MYMQVRAGFVAEVVPLGSLHLALLNSKMSSQCQGRPCRSSNMTSCTTNAPCKPYMETPGSLGGTHPAAHP